MVVGVVGDPGDRTPLRHPAIVPIVQLMAFTLSFRMLSQKKLCPTLACIPSAK